MDNIIERNFNNIRVIKTLEPGGQKEVFVVEHPQYGICVLKLIPLIKRDRVIREIEIIIKYKIKNVPQIFENGDKIINGKQYLYIFEEYIEGINLTAKILSERKLSLLDTYKLIDSLLSIEEDLEYIKVVHRDIKPDNILVDKQGNYYLIDFGIARALEMESLTMTGAVMGPHSVGYGAPELFEYRKAEIDVRADLFSIGVIGYESITGKHPFMDRENDNAETVRYKTMTVMPEDIVIEGDTQQQFMGLIQTLMKKQISKRPPTAKKAHEWLNALKDTLVFGGE